MSLIFAGNKTIFFEFCNEFIKNEQSVHRFFGEQRRTHSIDFGRRGYRTSEKIPFLNRATGNLMEYQSKSVPLDCSPRSLFSRFQAMLSSCLRSPKSNEKSPINIRTPSDSVYD